MEVSTPLPPSTSRSGDRIRSSGSRRYGEDGLSPEVGAVVVLFLCSDSRAGPDRGIVPERISVRDRDEKHDRGRLRLEGGGAIATQRGEMAAVVRGRGTEVLLLREAGRARLREAGRWEAGRRLRSRP